LPFPLFPPPPKSIVRLWSFLPPTHDKSSSLPFFLNDAFPSRLKVERWVVPCLNSVSEQRFLSIDDNVPPSRCVSTGPVGEVPSPCPPPFFSAHAQTFRQDVEVLPPFLGSIGFLKRRMSVFPFFFLSRKSSLNGVLRPRGAPTPFLLFSRQAFASMLFFFFKGTWSLPFTSGPERFNLTVWHSLRHCRPLRRYQVLPSR